MAWENVSWNIMIAVLVAIGVGCIALEYWPVREEPMEDTEHVGATEQWSPSTDFPGIDIDGIAKLTNKGYMQEVRARYDEVQVRLSESLDEVVHRALTKLGVDDETRLQLMSHG
jgi:hypothetical protein